MSSKTVRTSLRILSALSTILILCSCTASKKQRSAQTLSDLLCGNYTCNIDFTFSGKEHHEGKATITKNGYITRLDIHSPDPYSGLSIEYNVKGLPDSVAMHFSGMSVTLPQNAVAKINPVASLFAGDFARILAAVPKENLTEYQTDDASGICASLLYSDADITLYFSNDGSVPYSLEYSGNDINAVLTFSSFLPETNAE